MGISDWKIGGGKRDEVLKALELEPLGKMLAIAREKSGESIEEASRALRIPVKHLSSFEDEKQPEGLSMLLFRGQFLAYAKYLKLDSTEIEKKFFFRFGTASTDPLEDKRAKGLLPSLEEFSSGVEDFQKAEKLEKKKNSYIATAVITIVILFTIFKYLNKLYHWV